MLAQALFGRSSFTQRRGRLTGPVSPSDQQQKKPLFLSAHGTHD